MNDIIYHWATKHNVSVIALNELRQIFAMDGGVVTMTPDRTIALPALDATEAGVQSRVRLAAAQAGLLVWRNNVGAMQDDDGRVVRYGLANESKKENERVKSADLVGVKPGGQFWARECKPVGWHYIGQGREPAQLRWIQLVVAQGGDAAFSTGAI